jgi:hypothetical protein
MIGSEAAMRVKSRKPPAENFITSDEVTCASSSAVPTMIGRHDLDSGADGGPERAQSFDGVRVGAFRRGQDAPAVDEQLGETRIGTGMLGAGDRMRWYEMRAGGQIRRHVAHHGALDRADIGNDGAGLEMIGYFLRDGAAGADRNAQDHEIGILGSLRIRLHDAIDNAELQYPRAGFGRARGGDDFAGQSLFARGTRDRAADQPETDQRDLLE